MWWLLWISLVVEMTVESAVVMKSSLSDVYRVRGLEKYGAKGNSN